MLWSVSAWGAALPVYHKILKHPFLRELLNGSLPREKFIFYLRQDALYLAEFGRALASVAARLDDLEDSQDFIGFARDTMLVERALHESYLHESNVKDVKDVKDEPPESVAPSPGCLLYTGYVQRQMLRGVEIGLAAVLPCFWVYKEVGDYLSDQPGTPGNPYQAWIDTYGGEEYAEAVRRCINICDRAAEKATPATRAAMTEVYVMGTRLEWMFWDSAYRLEEWPV